MMRTRLTSVLMFILAGTPACMAPASASAPDGDDPLRARQWGLDQIQAPGAWETGAHGKGIVVAVVDSGVDLGHPDLEKQLVSGRDVTATDGRPPQDALGHGTFVAGIIAAVQGNGIGVAGVAPEARVMPVGVGDGATLSKPVIAEGIRWAADHGADVINLSLGQPVDQAGQDEYVVVEEAVEYAWARGAVIVAAAGNDSLPMCTTPARRPHVVCVAASDRRGLPAVYSNLPLAPDAAAAVRAPGGTVGKRCEDDEDVWSTTLIGSDLDAPCGLPLQNASPEDDFPGYDSGSGTSFAAPHVSGVFALVLGTGASRDAAIACVRDTASNRGRFDPLMGHGIVDAAAAVAACRPKPTPGSAGAGPEPAPSAGRPQGDTTNTTTASEARARQGESLPATGWPLPPVVVALFVLGWFGRVLDRRR